MFGSGKTFRKVAVSTVVLRSVSEPNRTLTVPFTFEENQKGVRRLKIAEIGAWYEDEIKSIPRIYYWLEGGPLPQEATIVPHV